MKWKLERADKFCKSVRDGTHDTPKQVDFGFKLITAKNIKNGQVDLGDAYNISEKDYIKINERSKVEKWDVLMSMIGNGLGRSAVIKDNPKYAIKNLALFKIGNEVKAKWLHYFLCSNEGQGIIFNTLQGSGQPFISLNLLRGLLIPVPPLTVMKKVIKILSLYDDLIENNQKQIKLLEEAAQRLYKEWFVDLRFPGYEKTPIIDGVPEGWEILTLDKISCRLEAGSRPKGGIDKTRKSGIVSIGAENVLGLGKYNFNDEKFIPKDYYLKMKKGKIVDKDILIYKDGAYIGKTTLFQNGYPHKEAAVNEHVFLLHMKNEYLQYFVFFTLYQHKYFLKMQQLNKNAAQPGINLKSLLSLDILVPSYKLIEQYNFIITPIMNDIFEKAKQNIKLVEIRNKLLQKLMSGEIEV